MKIGDASAEDAKRVHKGVVCKVLIRRRAADLGDDVLYFCFLPITYRTGQESLSFVFGLVLWLCFHVVLSVVGFRVHFLPSVPFALRFTEREKSEGQRTDEIGRNER